VLTISCFRLSLGARPPNGHGLMKNIGFVKESVLKSPLSSQENREWATTRFGAFGVLKMKTISYQDGDVGSLVSNLDLASVPLVILCLPWYHV